MVSNVASFGGGGVVGFRDMLRALRARRPDLEVVAVVPQDGEVARRCTEDGFTTEIAWTPWWAFGKWWRIDRIDPHVVLWLPYTVSLLIGVAAAVRQLRRLRPTAVVTNTMTIPSHAVAARLLGIPHYWMVREFGPDDHRLWFLFGYRTTVRLIGRLSTAVICNSQAVQRRIHELSPATPTHVVYPVVENPVGAPPRRRPGERMRALLVGYFSPAKGQELAVEAVAAARAAGVDIELTLVGAGRPEPLHRLARRLGVSDLVRVHGPTSDLGPYWAAAHVGLMCSRSEAFGRVTVEAMRAGLPVCGTDSGGTPELIEPGVAGLLSPPGDARALAANLMRLEADEDLRLRLARGALAAGRRFGRDRHDADFAAALGLN
ncbi:glycosyltransferase family 4 protein [uncultured Mycolicibacterium sp.]|uniref:glycosyltransferase family 4 protein n=1 Tax=uncultured Mycolicibacterium sp. TaxID=2320817 RepID=UPI00263549FE|nr:glycosyltransferase family 4 protein [uncultured Mycolicibacterium sp.]